MRNINLSDAQYLAPSPPKNLVRLGGKHDGGYVVDKAAAVSSACLVSFGISYDLQFEYEFASLSKFEKRVYMYDKSTVPISLGKMRRCVLQCFYFRSPRPLINYSRFIFMFKKLIRHESQLKRLNISNVEQLGCTTLPEVLSSITEQNRVFLKLDIEGDEYLIFDDIIANIKKIYALVIELHDITHHWREIECFIAALRDDGLLIDHLHANNYGGLADDGRPNVIEMSFSRIDDREPAVSRLPMINLDAPNTPLREDYTILFHQSIEN